MFQPFSFKDFTKKELEEIGRKKKEIKERTQSAAEALQACLQSDTFAKYRKELETADKKLIELGMSILRDVKDSKERVVLYDALFTRAELLSLLLKSITKDSL